MHTQLVSHLTDPSLISKFHFQNLQKHLDKDYGVNEVFATLANNCFEYNDLEYTYKMCAFDYTAQKPLHGGSETRLGKYFEKRKYCYFYCFEMTRKFELLTFFRFLGKMEFATYTNELRTRSSMLEWSCKVNYFLFEKKIIF